MNIINVQNLVNPPQKTIEDFITDEPLLYATKELIDIIVRDGIIILATLKDSNPYGEELEDVYVTLKLNGCLDKQFTDEFVHTRTFAFTSFQDMSGIFDAISVLDDKGNEYSIVEYVEPEPSPTPTDPEPTPTPTPTEPE